MTTRERWWLAFGLTFVAAVGLRDVASPDAFWHLNVGRWILERRELPLVDVYSHTKLGAPWREYEWLADVLWALVERRAGALGLILLKTSLLTGAAAFVAAALRLQGRGARVQALAVVGLAAGWNLTNDLRPDNFTLLFFAAELWALEAGRLGRLGSKTTAAFFASGALWANLHPGFAYGLVLPALYALESRPRLFLSWLAAGLAGTCLNPLGPALFLVLVEHGRHAAEFGRRIVEWRRPGLDWNCLPFWLTLAGGAAALARRRPGLAPSLLFAGTALWALASQRMIPYFVIAAAVALGRAAPPEKKLDDARAAAVLALLLLYFIPGSGRLTGGWDLRSYPVGAASFLEARAPELAGLKLYNPLEWGGYLSARLWPRYLVYADGRSLFLDMIGPDHLHKDMSPESWQAVLDRRRIELALMFRKMPDIGGKPYWETFMPASAWELIYEDDVALIFRLRPARRGR